jgi:hypothetical protein
VAVYRILRVSSDDGRTTPMNGSWRIVTVTLLALSCPGLAAAQTYRWTDDDGRTNYTQGIESVPERQRLPN